MATATPDFSQMSAAQIKEFIESQPAVQPPVEEVEEGVIDPSTGEPFEQPRDPETGRFVSQPPTEEFEATAEKEIDLGDGSGVQLFRGVGSGATQEEANINAYEALADELAKAQANATRKIQELSRQARQPAPPAPQTTPEDEARLSQRLMQEPSAVLREIREQAVREAQEQLRQEQQAEQHRVEEAHNAAVAFIQSTPDFYACPENQARIEKYMKLEGLPLTTQGISEAYNAIKDVLKPKPVAAPTRVARSSGISTRGSAAPPVRPQGFDEKGFESYLEQQGLSKPSPIRRKF